MLKKGEQITVPPFFCIDKHEMIYLTISFEYTL